jgi:hypothetical protein
VGIHSSGRSDSDHGTVGYRVVLADPVAARLWIASSISYVGDFIGLGALLLLAYGRSGAHPLGSAAVFGVQAVPAFLVSAAIGPWLDKIPRRLGLVCLCLIGAAALMLPVAFGGLWPVLAAAAVLGATRTVYNALRTGAMADTLARELRGRLVALMGVSNQISEVLGYLTGAGVAIAIGAGPALIADAVTFLIAAALLAGLPMPGARTGSRARASFATGITSILQDPTLRVFAPVVWIGLAFGAVPQSLAATALNHSHRGWEPGALAAMAAGVAISSVIVGRTSLSERVRGQFSYITLCGLAFAVSGLALHINPVLLVAGNFAVGLGSGWIVAAQTTFILVIPPQRMAHVTATMIGSLIVVEGLGALAFGAIAGAVGVSAAYLIAGALLVASGLAGLAYTQQHPQVLNLTRVHAGSVPPPRREESGRPARQS